MNLLNKTQSIALVLVAGAIFGSCSTLGIPYLNAHTAANVLPQVLNITQIFWSLDVFGPMIGAIVIGSMGDVKGPNYAIAVSLFLMGVSSVGFYFAPIQASTGVAAPILLIGMYAMRALAIGGAAASITIYFLDAAAPGRRGLYVSLQPLSFGVGVLTVSFARFFDASRVQRNFFASRDWRELLLVEGASAIVLAVLATRLAKNVQTPDQSTERALFPAGLGILISGWIIFTAVHVSGTDLSYSNAGLGGSGSEASYWRDVSIIAIGMAAAPLGGWLSDVLGRKSVMLTASVLLVPVLFVPLFLRGPNLFASEVLVLLIFVASVLRGVLAASATVSVVESLPSNLRVREWGLIGALASATMMIIMGPGGRDLLNGDVVLHTVICIAAVLAITTLPEARAKAQADEEVPMTEPEASQS
jgi:MFS transporter, MHS family, proline/betaine transporter